LDMRQKPLANRLCILYSPIGLSANRAASSGSVRRACGPLTWYPQGSPARAGLAEIALFLSGDPR
jgi:hypothetical protein